MESKCREKIEVMLRNLDNHGKQGIVLYEHNDVVNAMCQLAKEVHEQSYTEGQNFVSNLYSKFEYTKEQVEELHNKYIAALKVIEHTLTKLSEMDRYQNDSWIKFLLKECDTSNDNTFKLFNRGEVEELLTKQRELCAENVECCEGAVVDMGFEVVAASVNKESILNAKLKW